MTMRSSTLTYPTGVGVLLVAVIDMWYWQHMGLWGWMMMLAFWVSV
ncbi:MAG TPA: hypothetical protein VF148_03125 [Acidimicrobiia bacterium]